MEGITIYLNERFGNVAEQSLRRSKDPAVFVVYGLGHGLPVSCMEANDTFGLARDRGFIISWKTEQQMSFQQEYL